MHLYMCVFVCIYRYVCIYMCNRLLCKIGLPPMNYMITLFIIQLIDQLIEKF